MRLLISPRTAVCFARCATSHFVVFILPKTCWHFFRNFWRSFFFVTLRFYLGFFLAFFFVLSKSVSSALLGALAEFFLYRDLRRVQWGLGKLVTDTPKTQHDFRSSGNYAARSLLRSQMKRKLLILRRGNRARIQDPTAYRDTCSTWFFKLSYLHTRFYLCTQFEDI